MKNEYNSMLKDLNKQKYQVQSTEELEEIEQQNLRNAYGDNNKKYHEHYIIYGIPEGRDGK